MILARKRSRERITENCSRFVKIGAMFAEIRFGFLLIPGDQHRHSIRTAGRTCACLTP